MVAVGDKYFPFCRGAVLVQVYGTYAYYLHFIKNQNIRESSLCTHPLDNVERHYHHYSTETELIELVRYRALARDLQYVHMY